ncbi:MAG: TonB-dependent receptor [Haliscomenobacter sp.]|nr:TonB-dependent receptor [Haliscomenobacter sp.]MBP9872885.1 TonB-dependent receptor [Haliscomenobacter sp.]
MNFRFLLMLFFLSALFSNGVLGQTGFRLNGTIRSAEDGETLPGVSISVPSMGLGASSNEYGFYSLLLPSGDSLDVVFSFVGYQTQTRRIRLAVDTRLDIQLVFGVELETIEVTAQGGREEVRNPQMSVEVIQAKEVKMIPVLLGESDILKAIQLKPGIPSGAEGVTGLFVRGGGSDQNLFVLDEAVVYNPNHLFGFFSTFNTDAVKDLKLYKGGFPAQYGGRLSSVIDVRLQDGNNQEFSGAGGIGLLASRLTLEGPIKKDRSSFIVSGRRTYVDLITRGVNRAQEASGSDANPIPNYYFYDLNAKVNFQIGEKDRIFVSGYFGRDVFSFDGDVFDFNFDWGNATGTLRWNHVFSSRLFSNTTVTFSDYQYNIGNEVTGFSSNLGSNIQDVNGKADFYYALNNEHQFRFGAQLTGHAFTVGRLRAGSDDGLVSFSAGKDYRSLEWGAYWWDDWNLSDRFAVQAGFRWSGFQTSGNAYQAVEPRISSRFVLTDNLSLKASYAHMVQYLHLVANAGVALPTDVWYPSTAGVQPQRSDQVAMGLAWFLGNGWSAELETYYKQLDRQLEFVDGAQIFVNDELEKEFAIGKGRAYGFELGLEKKTGKLTGWVGYTLARVIREDFAPLDPSRSFAQTGQFAPIYDRRHDLSVVLFWEINKRWSASATFVYGSGDLRWLPVGRLTFQDVAGTELKTVVPVFQDRNNFRLPDYHRLDAGLIWKFFPKWGESDLTLSIVNAYDRRNVFFIYLDPVFENEDQIGGIQIPQGIKAKQVSLFPVLPAITWNFKF